MLSEKITIHLTNKEILIKNKSTNIYIYIFFISLSSPSQYKLNYFILSIYKNLFNFKFLKKIKKVIISIDILIITIFFK